MNYTEYKKKYGISTKSIAREVFFQNSDAMRIKKEKTAVINLEKIFNGVFRITYKKGFQAMSMRDLSKETGMSLGSLYAYFSSKESLLGIIQTQGQLVLKKNLEQAAKAHEDPREKLWAVIKAHVFLSELLGPWFYFTFMEARDLNPAGLKAVKSMEEYTQTILTDIFDQGEKGGVFKPGNHGLAASMIKAMQQDWYLKRWKYRQMKISVDSFAGHLVAMVASLCLVPDSTGL